MFNFSHKSILITGGTGSYGQTLVSILLHQHPDVHSITVFSRDEFKQYEMQRKFPKDKFPALQFIIGDIRDTEAIVNASKGIDIIIHAAALKQNISGEQFSEEFIKTNIDGTRNLIKAAIQNSVKRVLSLSTDKAVYPSTLYGASKLAAEKLLIAAHNQYKNTTLFSVLRLGNLFGSRGSISSDLQDKIVEGNIQITDPEMTRFSLTLEESIEHSYMAIKEMKGGEIFIPQMTAYRLGDLIQAYDSNLKINSSGPRLTEKIHEIALSKEEARFTITWQNFYILLYPNAPSYSAWKNKGKALSADFEYCSEHAERMTHEELKSLIHLHTS